jgi:hypothetical protein
MAQIGIAESRITTKEKEHRKFMKFLPENDFRSRRLILEPEDFAIGPDEADGVPPDLIDEPTWRSMISLQDDVSVRTSNLRNNEL